MKAGDVTCFLGARDVWQSVTGGRESKLAIDIVRYFMDCPYFHHNHCQSQRHKPSSSSDSSIYRPGISAQNYNVISLNVIRSSILPLTLYTAPAVIATLSPLILWKSDLSLLWTLWVRRSARKISWCSALGFRRTIWKFGNYVYDYAEHLQIEYFIWNNSDCIIRLKHSYVIETRKIWNMLTFLILARKYISCKMNDPKLRPRSPPKWFPLEPIGNTQVLSPLLIPPPAATLATPREPHSDNHNGVFRRRAANWTALNTEQNEGRCHWRQPEG